MSTTTIPLLSTKLHVVRPQPDVIVRERLSQRAEELTRRRLVLVSAPAGFGKTTLVGSWIEEHAFPAAWVSLDRGDNDLARFLRYLVASLQTIRPDVGSGLESALSMSPRPPVDAMLTSLVNELSAIDEHFLLILDDFHVIEDPAVTSAVLFLLEHGPDRLHLVITTRSDPSFPLSRFRVRGQLLEIRAADLRFTGSESRALFNGAMELGLSEGQITALEEKTEGWIAGLQMAALSVQGRADIDAFIAAFAGTDRYVLDYLVEEVLNRQTPDLKHAMLQLSILESFNASLVEAVTGFGSGAELIDTLERGNLFVVSLDNRREWFRYHTLFADLLAHHHARLYPEEVHELHRRAAIWYEADGQYDRAVEHARRAHDADLLVRVVEEHCLALMSVRFAQQLPYLDLATTLDDEGLRRHPRFALVVAAGLESRRDVATTAHVIDLIDVDALAASNPGATHELLANLWYYRASIALAMQDLPLAVEYGQRSLEELDAIVAHAPSSSIQREHVLGLQGLALSRSGEWERAERVWEDVLAIARRARNTALAISMLHNLSLWEGSRARLTASWARCEEILRLKETADASLKVTNTFQVDVAHAHQKMAVVLYDRNDLEGAHRLIRRALELYPKGLSLEVTPTLKAAIQIESALGNFDEAFRLVETWEKLPFPPHAAAYSAAGMAVRAMLELQTGSIEPVELWADTAFGSGADRLPKRTFLMSVYEETTYARLLLRTGRAAQALARLAPLDASLREKGLVRTHIDTTVLMAIASKALGRDEDAFELIAGALTLAAPERIVRVFLLDGADTLRIVRAWKKQSAAVDPLVARLIAMIEAATAGDASAQAPAETTVRVGSGLLEPLTSREIEILTLMAAGYSNQKIAGKLYLSVNTIKTHASNLFSKLGASSRVEAITRAREERIL
jgi:LuxR family maltose regulon positive regulatory protein